MFHQLRIQLDGVSRPCVWRRIAVHGQATFEDLHQAIQRALGWSGGQRYEFTPYTGRDRVVSGPGCPEGTPASGVRLDDVFPGAGRFRYVYGLPKGWFLTVTVQKTFSDEDGLARGWDTGHATLLAARGACPPEDCGGPAAYMRMKGAPSDHPVDIPTEDQ